MPIQHPTHGERVVKPSHWYTTAQLDDLGQAWVQAKPNNRLYCALSKPNENPMAPEVLCQIGPAIDGIQPTEVIDNLPYEIICPIQTSSGARRGYNQGSHWAAIAIQFFRDPDTQMLCMRAGYTNSSQFPWPAPQLKQIDTLFKNFRAVEPNIQCQYGVYAEQWKQPDGSACGPYAFANACRFLSNDRSEQSPDPIALREQQVWSMRTPSAIIECSTNTLLLEFLKQHVTTVFTEDSIMGVIAAYAFEKRMSFEDCCNIFKQDLYNVLSAERLNTRREMLQQAGLLPRAVIVPGSTAPRPMQVPSCFSTHLSSNIPPTGRQQQAHEPTQKSTVKQALAANATPSNALNHPLLPPISQPHTQTHTMPVKARGHDTEIIQHLRIIQSAIAAAPNQAAGGDYPLLHLLVLLSTPPSAQKITTLLSALYNGKPHPDAFENSLKVLYQSKDLFWKEVANTCQTILSCHQTLEKIPIKTIQDHSLKALNAQVTLLNVAIKREDAKFLQAVLYSINDFFSCCLKFISFGIWKPEYQKIQALKNQLTPSAKGLFKENLRAEQQAIQTCIKTLCQLDEAIQTLPQDLHLAAHPKK